MKQLYKLMFKLGVFFADGVNYANQQYKSKSRFSDLIYEDLFQ